MNFYDTIGKASVEIELQRCSLRRTRPNKVDVQCWLHGLCVVRLFDYTFCSRLCIIIINMKKKQLNQKGAPVANKKSSKKIVIFIVLIILMTIVGVLVWYFVYKSPNKNAAEDIEITEQMKVVKSETILEEIKNTESADERARLYLDLASIRQSEGQEEEALVAALKSIELKPSHEAYAIAGVIYKNQGLKEEAIATYEKALELTEKTDDPNELTDYNNYLIEINDLRG